MELKSESSAIEDGSSYEIAVSASNSAADDMLDRLKPDDDAVKLFVGQIPHDATEDSLKSYFEEFGTIHQLSIIRDRPSGVSKGCCFLTYHTRQSSVNAQKALHGLRIMPGAKRPLQVKPAVGAIQKEEERRLFVGMLSKSTNEDDLRAMFSPFGNIETCVVLRERDGHSRGCAFVTFTVRKSAIKAIAALNRSKTMEGCRSPLVVKFADTNKDKESKSSKQVTQTGDMSSGFNVSSMQFSAPPPVFGAKNIGSDSWKPPATNVPPPPLPASGSAQASNVVPNLQQLQAQIQGLAALAALATNPLLSAVLNPNSGFLQQLAGVANAAAATGNVNLGVGANPVAPGADILTQALSGLQQFNAESFSGGLNTSMNLNVNQQGLQPQQSQTTQYNPRDAHLKVPEGSNLFLFHLPPEYRESDIQMLFSPYGKVVSAKVFIDKVTNNSKCYGFVTYDNPTSAQNAIQALNGHMVNGRRMRVQVKGPREASKPY